MKVEVVGTGEFEKWYLALDEKDTQAVDFIVEFLAARGVTLGYPYTSAIKGVGFALRELRAQFGGRPLRVLHAFDPKRRAVLLLGGDKSKDGFYDRTVPFC